MFIRFVERTNGMGFIDYRIIGVRQSENRQPQTDDRVKHVTLVPTVKRRTSRFVQFDRLRILTLFLCVAAAIDHFPACAQDGVEQGRRLSVFAKHRAEAQFQEAERLARQTLTDVERTSPVGTSMAVPAWLANAALAVHDQGRYAEAETMYRRAYDLARAFWRGEHHEMTRYMENLARLYIDLTRYREAEVLLRRVLRLRETWNRPEQAEIANALNRLGIVCLDLDKVTEAESLHRRALRIREDLWGPLHDDVATSLVNLGLVLAEQGKYLDAESTHKKAISLSEQLHGPEHLDVSLALSNLGSLYFNIGRYDEAGATFRRVIAIRERHLRPNHPDLATSYANLALVFEHQGRFAEADVLQRRALEIRQEAFSGNHLDLASSFHSLASLYESHGRFAEAAAFAERALKIRLDVLGENNSLVADSLNQLAIVAGWLGRPAEEEDFYRRARLAREQALGKDHPELAGLLHNLAEMYRGRGQPELAEPLQREALRIQQQNFSSTYHGLGLTLAGMAQTAIARNELSEALSLLNQAIQLQEVGGAGPDHLRRDYLARARLRWRMKQNSDALADGYAAMRFAEQQRARAAGGDVDRGRLFGKSGNAFHQVVEWQAELGNVAEAFVAAERFRARSLLDHLETQGVDLLAGVPVEQARRLRRRESNAKTRVASLRQKINQYRHATPATQEAETANLTTLNSDLVKAQFELINVDRDIRTASAAYRLTTGNEFQPVSLKDIQSWVASESAILLEYVVTSQRSWLFVVTPQAEPRVVPLTITESHAESLGTTAGPLTAARLSEAMRVDNQSLLKRLSSTDANAALQRRLNALWLLLIPENERQLLADGSLKKLIVVPDGELSQLPFATLVVDPANPARYLLDVGPPIVSAPSATVLLNLMRRPEPAPVTDRKPVLSIGDPSYAAGESTPATSRGALNSATAVHYRAAGGRLTRLPFAAHESQWVASAFIDAGLAADTLLAQSATERNVRLNVDGRRIIHLACHGLVDHRFANFFGSLALTPAPIESREPDDDGFLTLPEICELPLRHCELALLSACETNVGPYQFGEGTWGLSRGFLIAGARRVMASNWLVDDEAAASLVSYFCAGLAADQAKGIRVQHAHRLQAAQRWIRNQERWQSPAYWGTFVMIGFD